MKYFSYLIIAFSCNSCLEANAAAQFTNFECNSLDKNFSKFEYCHIKAANRTYKYIALKVNLLQLPITNFSLNLSFYKRSSGYSQFFFNGTEDMCKFFKTPESNLIFEFLVNTFLSYTNFNHGCPFEHDLLLDKLPVSHVENVAAKFLPMLKGEYVFNSLWIAYNVPRAAVKAYVTLT